MVTRVSTCERCQAPVYLFEDRRYPPVRVDLCTCDPARVPPPVPPGVAREILEQALLRGT